ncbi:unnamed protein product [Peronospora belbahrii]|uniref:Cytochrome b561 domain-containing protein n=1 Tax=Peronospora belbahrii TaxID=622444 RepID=A0AAU9KUQ9_9STRA|nr:unnamed protein product [Peronospora belbahrii]CAH0516780.1 unnamed protein product [Peronospora belbahrii]
MCLCSFNLQPFLPHQAPTCDHRLKLSKPVSVKTSRPLRKTRRRQTKRAWCDRLIYSNLVYALAAIMSFSCDQKLCGVLQMGAAIASTMFHRSKETKYLLLDALISGTLGLVFIFSWHRSLSNEWYGILTVKVLLASLCVFTWLYCGMPGGERYDKWHNRWHYVSGATTISTTLFLTLYFPEFDALLHELIWNLKIVRSMRM